MAPPSKLQGGGATYIVCMYVTGEMVPLGETDPLREAEKFFFLVEVPLGLVDKRNKKA